MKTEQSDNKIEVGDEISFQRFGVDGHRRRGIVITALFRKNAPKPCIYRVEVDYDGAPKPVMVAAEFVRLEVKQVSSLPRMPPDAVLQPGELACLVRDLDEQLSALHEEEVYVRLLVMMRNLRDELRRARTGA